MIPDFLERDIWRTVYVGKKEGRNTICTCIFIIFSFSNSFCWFWIDFSLEGALKTEGSFLGSLDYRVFYNMPCCVKTEGGGLVSNGFWRKFCSRSFMYEMMFQGILLSQYCVSYILQNVKWKMRMFRGIVWERHSVRKILREQALCNLNMDIMFYLVEIDSGFNYMTYIKWKRKTVFWPNQYQNNIWLVLETKIYRPLSPLWLLVFVLIILF